MTRAGVTARGRRGFTLIEVILVILLLALFAAVTAPRLTGTQSRRADMEAAAVASLLSIVAQRDATTTEPLAIVYDAPAARFSVEVRRPRTGADGRVEEPAWRADPLIAPVTLSLVEVRDASTELETFGKRSWRVGFPTSEPRPAVRIVLNGRGNAADRVWTIELASGSPTATMVQAASMAAGGTGGAVMQGIDLDAAGMGDQPW